MPKAILNYTTTVDAGKTLAEIQRVLAAHGARRILIDYDDRREPSGIAFEIATEFGDRPFVLPARVGRVEATLAQARRQGKVPPRLATREQAVRVAWRIVKDWIEAQLAMIQSGNVTLEEVMLPWMRGKGGQTVFEAMRSQQLALPKPEE